MASGIAYGDERFSLSLKTSQDASPVLAATVCAKRSTFVLDGFADDETGAAFAAHFEHETLLGRSHERHTRYRVYLARSVDPIGATFATGRVKNVSAAYVN